MKQFTLSELEHLEQQLALEYQANLAAIERFKRLQQDSRDVRSSAIHSFRDGTLKRSALTQMVMIALFEFPTRQFQFPDLWNKVVELFPTVKVRRTHVSSLLSRMTKDGIIVIVDFSDGVKITGRRLGFVYRLAGVVSSEPPVGEPASETMLDASLDRTIPFDPKILTVLHPSGREGSAPEEGEIEQKAGPI